MTGALKEKNSDDQSVVANAIFQWWQELEKNPGGRAMLRRSKNPNQVAMLPIYYSLLGEIRKLDPEFKGTYSLPLLAGILSHVKSHFSGKSTATAMREVVKDLRFRKLLRTEDPEDLYIVMIRLIRMMNHRANVYDLIHSLLNWREWIRRKWAEDYYLNPNKD